MKSYSDYPIKICSVTDNTYPSILKKIKDPPKKIYFRGDLNSLKQFKSLGIVGSRAMTRYGKDVIDEFVSACVSKNIITVSGFMYGIDTQVHTRTTFYGGKTIAVFGCGLDVVYPPENKDLYIDILEKGGAVVSEYEPQAKPHLWKFPRRNRIVVGLSSLGLLVVEAGERSGSLVTAEIALKNMKKVYAVPGLITSAVSKGTNNLIKEGRGIMVTDPSELFVIEKHKINNKSAKQSNYILELLKREPLSIDEIAQHSGKKISEVSTEITLLILSGDVADEGGLFVINKN